MTTIPNTTGSAYTVQTIIDNAVLEVLSLRDEGGDVPGVEGPTHSASTVRTIIDNAVLAVLSLRAEGQDSSLTTPAAVRALIDNVVAARLPA